ncbi:hypothetical protein ACO0QE_001222 [Hanseniaspora vineae]
MQKEELSELLKEYEIGAIDIDELSEKLRTQLHLGKKEKAISFIKQCPEFLPLANKILSNEDDNTDPLKYNTEGEEDEDQEEEDNGQECEEDVDDKFDEEEQKWRSKHFLAQQEHTEEEMTQDNRTQRAVDASFAQEMFPPENFSNVIGEIYRSSFPRRENLHFLKKQIKLKSVLVLLPEEYPKDLLQVMTDNNIQLFQCPMQGNKEPFIHISDKTLTNALTIVLNPENHPILIHCNKGKHRTGSLVGCIRKLQNWSLTMIFDEYRKFAFPKARALDQQFIEMFDTKDIEQVSMKNGWLPIEW